MIKAEVDLSDYSDLANARRQIARFIVAVYNDKRIHLALGYLNRWNSKNHGEPSARRLEQPRLSEEGNAAN